MKKTRLLKVKLEGIRKRNKFKNKIKRENIINEQGLLNEVNCTIAEENPCLRKKMENKMEENKFKPECYKNKTKVNHVELQIEERKLELNNLIGIKPKEGKFKKNIDKKEFIKIRKVKQNKKYEKTNVAKKDWEARDKVMKKKETTLHVFKKVFIYVIALMVMVKTKLKFIHTIIQAWTLYFYHFEKTISYFINYLIIFLQRGTTKSRFCWKMKRSRKQVASGSVRMLIPMRVQIKPLQMQFLRRQESSTYLQKFSPSRFCALFKQLLESCATEGENQYLSPEFNKVLKGAFIINSITTLLCIVIPVDSASSYMMWFCGVFLGGDIILIVTISNPYRDSTNL